MDSLIKPYQSFGLLMLYTKLTVNKKFYKSIKRDSLAQELLKCQKKNVFLEQNVCFACGAQQPKETQQKCQSSSHDLVT